MPGPLRIVFWEEIIHSPRWNLTIVSVSQPACFLNHFHGYKKQLLLIEIHFPNSIKPVTVDANGQLAFGASRCLKNSTVAPNPSQTECHVQPSSYHLYVNVLALYGKLPMQMTKHRKKYVRKCQERFFPLTALPLQYPRAPPVLKCATKNTRQRQRQRGPRSQKNCGIRGWRFWVDHDGSNDPSHES